MRKSVYEAARMDFWFQSGAGVAQVARDVAAAEAAGIQWDPEKEPLPARLAVNAMAVYDPECGEIIARIATSGAGLEANQRTCRTAVRCNNAWPALRRMVQEHRDRFVLRSTQTAAFCEELLAILDGREAP